MTTRRRSTATHFIAPSGMSATEATGTNPLESLIRFSTGCSCGDGFCEVLVFLAIGATDRLYGPELLAGSPDIALDHISLPEILAYLRVARIERYRLKVVSDSLVDPAQLAGRIAAIVEGL